MVGILKIYKRSDLVGRFVSVLSIDILVKASAFILLPVFLRLMTQSEFGLYNYVISIIQTFSLVMNFGLYIPQSKLYHGFDSEERGKLLFTIVTTLFFLLLFLYTVCTLFGLDDWVIRTLFANEIEYSKYKTLITLGLVVSVCTFMLTNFFYTSGKIRQVKAYNVYRIIVVNLASILALFFLNSDNVGIRLGFTYGVEILLLCFFATHFFKELVPSFDKKIMQRSLKMGLPIMISAIFGIVINFFDKFLLQKYGSLVDLSNYYLAFSFASIIPLIFASFQNVWLPIFLKEKDLQRNFQKTKQLIPKLMLVFVFLSLAIWLLFYLMLWLQIIPDKYSDVVWILPFLLITQIFAAITPLFSNYLVYFEKTNLVSVAGLFVSAISIGLGMWLIQLFGVLGAAITTLVGNFCYLVIYYYLVLSIKKKYLKIPTL
jgi:O-antigen/teichoic acid export membrane protein